MKRLVTIIILFFLSTVNISTHVEHYNNLKLLKYDLFRNGKLIGYHNYNFEREKEFLNVKSLVNFKITKLGVDLYKYEAESVERYKNDTFFNFSSKTIQNKKEKYVNISLHDDKKNLIIDGSSYKGLASKDFIVGTWWNHEIIKAKAQISAISGRIIKQNVNFVGKEEIILDGKKYQTLHFKFSSIVNSQLQVIQP